MKMMLTNRWYTEDIDLVTRYYDQSLRRIYNLWLQMLRDVRWTKCYSVVGPSVFQLTLDINT